MSGLIQQHSGRVVDNPGDNLLAEFSSAVFAMEMVRSVFSDYPGLNLIFYGLFLIVIMIYYPGGVAQFYAFLTERFKASRLVRLAVGNRLDSP